MRTGHVALMDSASRVRLVISDVTAGWAWLLDANPRMRDLITAGCHFRSGR